MRNRTAAASLGVIVLAGVMAGAGPKKPLDHDVYELWSSIEGEAIAPDGSWLLYSLTKERGDGRLHVRSLVGEDELVFERGVGGRFSYDGTHAVFRIVPPLEEVRAAKRAEKKKDEMPKDALGIVDLATGDLTTIERIKSFAMPEKAGGWVAVHLESPEKKKDEEKEINAEGAEGKEEKAGEKEKTEVAPEGGAAPEAEPEVAPEVQPAPEAKPSTEPAAVKAVESEPGAAAPEVEEKDEDKKKKDKKEGTELALINLATDERRSFEHVLHYAFDEMGQFLAYVVSTKDGESDGVYVVDLASGGVTDVMTGEGSYTSLAFDKGGTQLAFLSNRDDYDADEPAWRVHWWRAGEDSSETIAALGDAGIPQGWWISEHHGPSFTENGKRLMFGLSPRPAPTPQGDDKPIADEQAKLDIWHWNEPDLKTMQLNNLESEKKRSYLAVIDLDGDRTITRLADEAVRTIEIGSKGDAAVAIGERDERYRKMVQWDVQTPTDLMLIDVRTGERQAIVTNVKAQRWRGSWLSPASKYAHYWDQAAGAWMAYDIEAGELINLSEHIPQIVFDEENDTPSLPGPYGLGGWLKDDAGVLIYDRYDVWLVDPHDPTAARCVTEGAGRDEQIRLRVVDLDREEAFVDPDEPLLLSAFNTLNRNEGFYRDHVTGVREPELLLMAARRFGTPRQAEEAETLVLTRESFSEFPDLWATDPDFSNMRQVSDANPQQSEYRWGDVQLVKWINARGEEMEGLLYRPENFDPKKKYPMMVYFYERFSDNLHSYSPPTPHRSIIRFSFYASRGYLVFVPDITYEEGKPGKSAVDCVLPGVVKLIEQGFVDPGRIGVQGHSWGGYQSAYLVTQTDMFAACGSGAPVANMTSAYGGIRWGSGMSRQFQYEKTQSRIGGTLWEKPLLYIENSPLFHIENVNTPMLILHNDEDGAVPWEQGIELFMALRRLGKPAWFLNYNGEPHWPTTYPNRRDYAIRMQQFFDHYLKDAPMPRWMAEGVPAVNKEREHWLELMEE